MLRVRIILCIFLTLTIGRSADRTLYLENAGTLAIPAFSVLFMGHDDVEASCGLSNVIS